LANTATLDNQLTGVSVADAVTLGEATSVYLPITIAESDAVTTGESVSLTNLYLVLAVSETISVAATPVVFMQPLSPTPEGRVYVIEQENRVRVVSQENRVLWVSEDA
jgi:hypothetical protein